MNRLDLKSKTFINSPLTIGHLKIPHRLIQGPLAGFSCAPFRQMFNQFAAPAYSVSEMISAQDLILKHAENSRYLHRAPQEKILAYQISGNDSLWMAKAAAFLQSLGADLIDINCGCPKTKIRKKGAGSALLEEPEQLIRIVQSVRQSISIPLTVKIRIQAKEQDLLLARAIEAAGADALIVHGRRWMDEYDKACDWQQIAKIKKSIQIPVIANGDIQDSNSLAEAIKTTACDAFMISRAGTGKPWLYKELLEQRSVPLQLEDKMELFMQHISALSLLENEYKALLQARSLVRYYFKGLLEPHKLQDYYRLNAISDVKRFISSLV